ncbi:hypothetical protein SAMN04487939_101723 [Lysobacter sp. yr284]|uniref:hypothetical protein n=1 Tax=Lysobacter sp. yr284 TaxID=1761791 RepID=UPI00089CBB7B|nr:hypothetical protein [Lysobacter sp. yr284]SDY30373.1 hypothetical protein SAMN04487939_101723 [Lysobacter sp. yr284]
MALGTFFKWAGGGVVALIAALCLLLQGAYWYGASMLPERLPQPRREYPPLAREVLWRSLGGGDRPLEVRRLNIFSYTGLIFEAVATYLAQTDGLAKEPADLRLVDWTSSAARSAIVEARYAHIVAPAPSGASNAEALQQFSYDHQFESLALFIRSSREWPAERMADLVLDSGDYGRDSATLEQAAQAYFAQPVERLTREQLTLLVLLDHGLHNHDPQCRAQTFRDAYAQALQEIGDPKLPTLSAQTLARLKPIDCPPDA